MGVLVCPACGTPHPAGQKFCGECGSALPRLCPACGATATPTQKFCGECGTALPAVALPTQQITHQPLWSISPAIGGKTVATPAVVSSSAEHRLVTALFCDLVSFTPLVESLGAEEVRDLQAEYFGRMAEEIERYGGTVEKYAGDAVLALFGVPVAHEDDAERAVLCALGMQAAIEPVAAVARARWKIEPTIRVGVDTGDVVSGTWNASERQDMAVTGDAINTAARLQAAAEPGDVLVGAETMRLTLRRIRYGDVREMVLKGKRGPIPVYPALGLRARRGERWETGDEQATPLIGRERELVVLLDAWRRAQTGEGGLINVIGDAGVGKSRLLAELTDTAAPGSTARVVRARCLSYGQQIGLWLIADLLRSLVGIAEGDDLEEVRAKLTTALTALLIRSDAETQREATDVLGEVLGLPPGNSVVAEAEPQIRRQALIRSLKLVLGALTERVPTVLVLEDVHWMDAASQDVVKEVLGDVPGLRMLVLVAQRPGWNAPWSEWGWTERITLRPLREEDATLLAGAVLGGMSLSPELEQYVAERAGGNPFFVEEMLRALAESGGLIQTDGVMRLTPGAAERLPSTLTEVLLARLDRLEAQVRSVAQVASVIGRSFAVRLLAQVMEREQTALELPLSALQQAEIAFPRRGGDLEYVFKHVTMREAAYNTLVQRRRQELHLQTARAVAALYPSEEYVEIIAYHYARTAEQAEAAVWLERAGDRAGRIYADDTAIANYEEARRRQESVGGTPDTVARLDEKIGEILYREGRYDEAVVAIERSIHQYQEIRDLEGAGRGVARLGTALNALGTPQEGVARIEPMVALLAQSGPSPALASLHLSLAINFQNLGRYDEMRTAAERAAEIAETIGDKRLWAWALERRATALMMLGRAGEARPILVEAIRWLERLGDLPRLNTAFINLGESHRVAGNLQEARRYNEQSLAVSERIGSAINVSFALLNLGEILLTLGEWKEARARLAQAEEKFQTHSSVSVDVSYIPYMVGQLLLWTGDWEAAEVQLRRALAKADATGIRVMLEVSHRAMAELELLRGEAAAAIVRLKPLTGQEGGFRIMLETTLAWAYLESGDVARADELAKGAVDRARNTEEVLALVDALRVQGMVRQRRGERLEAEHILEEGLALARTLPFPYAEARILDALGRSEEALAIFQRLGAARDAQRMQLEKSF
jgi:class 3 adenylate cyclase/tetratricopeptide (TPR) repeat protein